MADDNFLVFLLATPMILFVGAMGLPTCVNTTNSMSNRYQVEGIVTAPVTSKMSVGGSKDCISGSEKYAVRLDNGQIYNCSNTQCSQLQPGDEVRFSCYREWHVFTPDEDECRFESLILH